MYIYVYIYLENTKWKPGGNERVITDVIKHKLYAFSEHKHGNELLSLKKKTSNCISWCYVFWSRDSYI
jgi:hypothetical protein